MRYDRVCRTNTPLKTYAGKTLYNHQGGYNGAAEDASPLEPDQYFWIASCTKVVASVAALQCVERGLITLDAPLDKHLPELDALPIITASGEKDLFEFRKASGVVTLRQLLTHSSGVVYDFINPTLAAWRGSRGETPSLSETGHIEEFSIPRIADPGEAWNYGTGLDWASHLVERLTETGFEDYVQKNIAQPLGIKSWTWHMSKRPSYAEKLMKMSERKLDGTLAASKTPFRGEPLYERGGAGIYTTVDDYMRFLTDLLRDSPITLKKETMDMMFAPQFEEGSKLQKSMWDIACAPLVGQSMEGVIPNQGLGGYLTTHDITRDDGYFKPKGTMCWHGMANLCWNANREKGIAYFFATQVIPWNEEQSQALIKAFETAVWAEFSSYR